MHLIPLKRLRDGAAGFALASLLAGVVAISQPGTKVSEIGGGGDAPAVVCINNTPTCVLATNLTPTVVTSTPIPTSAPATATVAQTSGNNLLANPGFEGAVRPVIFNEVNVVNGWQPYYCASGYLNYRDNCPADRRDTRSPARSGYNDPLEVMARTEYKPSGVTNRVHGEKQAQQWFNSFRVHDSGVYQTISVSIGATCTVGAYIQSWSSNHGTLTSDLATEDDRAEYRWFIRVDPSGGVDAYAANVLISRAFTYDDGIYDKYVLITYQFLATGNKATVFFGSRALWPMSDVNSYIDDAFVKCTGGSAPPTTLQPTQTPPATATATAPTNTPTTSQTPFPPTPTQVVLQPTEWLPFPGKDSNIGTFTVPHAFYSTQDREVHSNHDLKAETFVRKLPANERVTAYYRWDGLLYTNWPGGSAPPNDEFLCVDEDAHWIANPDKPLEWPQVLFCREWIALAYHGSWYMNWDT